MLIRYKFWDRDGLTHYSLSVPGVPGGRVIFADSDKGIADIRQRVAVEFLLKDSYNFEVAYDGYGIEWDAKGNQVEKVSAPVKVNASAAAAESEAGETSSIFKRGPGRPKKG